MIKIMKSFNPKMGQYKQIRQFCEKKNVSQSEKILNEKDYYKVLNMTKYNTHNQIRISYYNLAKIYHPDLKPENEKVFAHINKAYEVLSNEKSRKEYDDQQIPDEEYYQVNLFGVKLNLKTVFTITFVVCAITLSSNYYESQNKCPLNHDQRKLAQQQENHYMSPIQQSFEQHKKQSDERTKFMDEIMKQNSKR